MIPRSGSTSRAMSENEHDGELYCCSFTVASCPMRMLPEMTVVHSRVGGHEAEGEEGEPDV